MKNHYSQQYCIIELINKYCTDEWKQLIKDSEDRLRYDAGVRIFKEGAEAKRIKILLSGKVKVHCSLGTEKEQIIRLAADKQILGHRALGANLVYSVSATTLTECEVLHIPLKLFLNVLKANNLFCFHFLMFFAEELKNTEQHIKLNKAKNLDQRIATGLLDILVAFGYDTENPKLLAHFISRKDFASLSNTTYESVIRTLKKFDKMGLIKIKGKQIEILNEDDLIEISTLNY